MIYRTNIILSEENINTIWEYLSLDNDFDMKLKGKFLNNYTVDLSMTSTKKGRVLIYFEIFDVEGCEIYSKYCFKKIDDLNTLYTLKKDEDIFYIYILYPSSIKIKNTEHTIERFLHSDKHLNFEDYWNFADFNNEYQFTKALYLAMICYRDDITEEEFNDRSKMIIEKLNYYGYFIEECDKVRKSYYSSYEEPLNNLIYNVFKAYENLSYDDRDYNKLTHDDVLDIMHKLFYKKEDTAILKGYKYLYDIIDY